VRAVTLPLDAARLWRLKIGESLAHVDEKDENEMGDEAMQEQQRLTPNAATASACRRERAANWPRVTTAERR
jgi:hypothetical protein